MAIGLLGSALAGAAQGYGATDQANVAEQNKEIMQENLLKEQAQVQDMYNQAAEQRHIQQTIAARSAMATNVNAEQTKQLASVGLVAPGTPESEGASLPGGPGAGDNAKGTVANAEQLTDAYNQAARKLGYTDPDKVLQYGNAAQVAALKVNASMANVQVQAAASVAASEGRGLKGTQYKVDNPNPLNTDHDLAVSLSKQVDAERKIIDQNTKLVGLDSTATPETKASAHNKIISSEARIKNLQIRLDALNAGMQGSSTAPSGALASPGQTQTAAPISLDAYANSLGK